jgi:DNA-binding NarL/FixJ family response regulator
MIRTVIVDGKDSDRDDTKKTLLAQGDFDIVATGKDGYEAIRLVDACKPDMLLLDIKLTYLDGVKAASLLNQRYPRLTTIILTSLDDTPHIKKAMYSGIPGYLLKNRDMEKLAELIRAIHVSGCLIYPRIDTGLAPRSNEDRQFSFTLTKIELQIIRHIGTGMENQEIAEIMCLKRGTIRNHISVILQKTTLRNRTQLAIFAVQNGLAQKTPALKPGVAAARS